MSLKSSHSRALSKTSLRSVTSKKSVKLLNASLERIHTFGMANIHKSLYDYEKIDNQYQAGINKKSIQKTTSLAKLKEANIEQMEKDPVTVELVEAEKQIPTTSLKFTNQKQKHLSEMILSPEERSPEQRKKLTHSKFIHSQSMNVQSNNDTAPEKIESQTDKQSQSLNIILPKDVIINPNASDFSLKFGHDYSSMNCISDQPNKAD